MADVFITFQPFTLCQGWNQLITAGFVKPASDFQKFPTTDNKNSWKYAWAQYVVQSETAEIERPASSLWPFSEFIALEVRDRKCPDHAHSKPPLFLPRHVSGKFHHGFAITILHNAHCWRESRLRRLIQRQPCFWLAAGTPVCRVREIVRLCPS